MSSNPTEAALQDARAAYDAAPDHRPGITSKKTMEARKALNAARIAYATLGIGYGKDVGGMSKDDKYPVETLGDDDDNGTMPESLDKLAVSVIGRKIVSIQTFDAVPKGYESTSMTLITLDNGTRVRMVGRYDCCAYSDVNAYLLHPELVDHAITGVGTTDEYTRWHIYPDYGDILELTVDWSAGNAFYYAYGFDILVEDIPESEGIQ